MIVASSEGGMEIEEISAKRPESIVRSTVEPAVGLQAFQAREIAFALNIPPALTQQMVRTLLGCYRAFTELDATMVEINPLVITSDDRILCLDAKMTFDGNALFRHPHVAELRDKSQEDPRESRAADRGLNYIGLDGNIGCIVNGAGLAMATMDTIKLAGGEPANFLDIGGGATPERVAKAFRLVMSDSKVQAILVNIFAGINRCDWVADGVVQALAAAPVDVPVVVRLAGTNVEDGLKILAQSGLPIIRAGSLMEAAEPRGHRLEERPGAHEQAEGGLMSILLDGNSRVIVQGITGRMAQFHTKEMLDYGTRVVGGVVPGKGGETVHGVPVFDTVKAAVAATQADASLVFVPPPFAADSIMEAADGGIRYCVCITDGIPAQDMIRVKRYMMRYPRERRMRLTGPNCAGTISPGKALLGIMPGHIYLPGHVGIVGRSGTLGYEAAQQLKDLGLGISTSVGIGGDPINGSSFRDILELFEQDPETHVVCMIGEIGGPQEAEAAAYIHEHMAKPVVSYIAGLTAPKGRTMGHAGAIISAFGESASEKVEILTAVGVTVAEHPSAIGSTVAEVLKRAA